MTNDNDQGRDEFFRRWKTHIAGLAIYGAVSEMRDGPLVRTTKILEIPDQVERLLGLMWDHAAKLLDKPLPVKPPVEQAKTNNGQPTRAPVKT